MSDEEVLKLREENKRLKNDWQEAKRKGLELINLRSIRITELEKENAELKKQVKLDEEIIIGEQQEINRLEKQIEKMKCCGNCKHNVYNCGERYCKYDWNREKDCRNKNQWELAE